MNVYVSVRSENDNILLQGKQYEQWNALYSLIFNRKQIRFFFRTFIKERRRWVINFQWQESCIEYFVRHIIKRGIYDRKMFYFSHKSMDTIGPYLVDFTDHFSHQVGLSLGWERCWFYNYYIGLLKTDVTFIKTLKQRRQSTVQRLYSVIKDVKELILTDCPWG